MGHSHEPSVSGPADGTRGASDSYRRSNGRTRFDNSRPTGTRNDRHRIEATVPLTHLGRKLEPLSPMQKIGVAWVIVALWCLVILAAIVLCLAGK